MTSVSDPQLMELKGALGSDTWRDRKDAVDALCERLRALPDEPTVEAIGTWLLSCVEDPKWEVRQAVARAAEFLFHDSYDEIVEHLAEDVNSHVARRVARTTKRRQQRSRLEERGQEQVQSAVNLVRRLRRRYGSDVADTCLEIAERMYGARFNETVHEMVTVIAGLKGLDRRLKLALESKANKDQCPDIARQLREQHNLLERFIRDARDFLRHEETDGQRLKLVEAVEAALERLKAAGFHALVYIEIPKSFHVVVPQHRLIEALCSLLKNAFEALDGPVTPLRGRSGPGGKVRITAESTDNQRVVLKIADTGCGMSKEDLAQAFRGGITNKGRVGKDAHTGFGLPLARKIIERECRGEFEVDSALGRGTVVTMELPTQRESEESTL